MPEILQLDIQGELCPSCLLLTLKTLNEEAARLRAGALELVVLTDDRQATATIPDVSAKMGYRTHVDRVGNAYRIRIHV